VDCAIDVKAMVLLRAEVIAARFHWLRYEATSRCKELWLGALRTAIAVMTKGLFTVYTNAAPFFCVRLLGGRLAQSGSREWLLAILLSLLGTAPDWLALAVQFGSSSGGHSTDAFGAIRFFVWGSQFGRFCNTGPIRNGDGSPRFTL
jgi:hypothetical protein